MGKFKKNEGKAKKKIINRVKQGFANLTEDQKMLQFQLAWSGVAPKEAKGFMGRIASKASSKTPGKIYEQIYEDIDEWIYWFKTKEVNEEVIKRLRKNLLKKAYDFSKYSRTVKHLSNQEIEQYKDFSGMIETILSFNENNLFKNKHLSWIKNVLLKDLKKSEETEKTKMMKDFGII